MKKVHDRLHLKDHQKSCREGDLNPDLYIELKSVNTEVAEQFFAHLLNFVKLFKNSNLARAKTWMLLIVHLWNKKKMVKINNSTPSIDQLKKIPNLKTVKRYKCFSRSISVKSQKKKDSLFSQLMSKSLKPWVCPGIDKEIKFIGTSKRRKIN